MLVLKKEGCYVMSDFYNTKEVRARKAHKCFHCGEDIQVGEIYVYTCGVYEGDFFTCKEHKLCSMLRDLACDFNGENEFDHDTVHYFLHDEMCGKCKDREECDYSQKTECKRKFVANRMKGG